MAIHDFGLFVVASLALNLTPGNDMIYVISRSAGQGAKAGMISSLGIMAGCMVHIIAAMIGLSAIIARSALAFDIIKYAGAAYLFYLGARSLFGKRKPVSLAGGKERIPLKKLFWQGAVTNVLNPKVALFFLAFLPQFIDYGSKAKWEILFLGSWFNVSGTIVNVVVALLFGTIGNWISRSPRFLAWQERVTGVLLVALGIKVALSTRK